MGRAIVHSLAVLAGALVAYAAAAEPAYRAPRTGFGQPDLSGAWSNATLTPQVRSPLFGTRSAMSADEVRRLEGAQDAKDAAGVAGDGAEADNVGAYDRAWIDNGVRVMRVDREPRTSLLTTSDGQPPPKRGEPARTLPAGAGSAEAGLQAVKEAADRDQFAAQGSAAVGRMGSFESYETRSLGERCYIGFGRSAGPPMFPNGWYNNNYLIQQSPDAVAIVVEMVHDARVVRLNAKHRADDVRPWFGDSIGWYEGDTLVVETTHLPETLAYFGVWKDLKVTERFTRVAEGRLRYSFTVEAPSAWDRPWGGEYEFHALKGQVFEYACHEGNYALPGILAGAREDERRAAQATSPARPGGQ
jgi:hypothetical protein